MSIVHPRGGCLRQLNRSVDLLRILSSIDPDQVSGMRQVDNDGMPTTNTAYRPHGHLDVLDGLPPDCRNAVMARCQRRAVAKGKAVWKQGESADYLIIVVSGKVISWHETPNGKAGTTGFWGPGDIVGLGDMGLSNVRQHTLRSLEPCSLLTLSFRDFEDVVRRFPDFSLRVIKAFSVRLRWVAQLAVALAATSAIERVCAILLALTQRFGIPHEQGVLIDLKLTNEQLAAICGISRQFANSTLQSLREQRLLAAAPGLILTDLAALERIAYNRQVSAR